MVPTNAESEIVTSHCITDGSFLEGFYFPPLTLLCVLLSLCAVNVDFSL